MLTIRRRFNLLATFLSLLLSNAFPTQATALEQVLSAEHKHFYKSGQLLDIGNILEFTNSDYSGVASVTLNYNMVKSKLAVEWIYNDQIFGHSPLKRGLLQEISFRFEKSLPASVKLRFTGPDGQIQVTHISAVVLHSQQTTDLSSQEEDDYNLASQLFTVSPGLDYKEDKLARQVKEQMVQSVLRNNLLDSDLLQTSIAEKSTINIKVKDNTVTLSGSLAGGESPPPIIGILKDSAARTFSVERVITAFEIADPPVLHILPFVPDVVGTDPDEAIELINTAGFLPSTDILTTYNSGYLAQEGLVVAQEPTAGTREQKGTTINITVYDPPVVPDVIGLSRDEAVTVIENSGFRYQLKFYETYSPGFAGNETRIVRQQPEAGPPTSPGSTIVITLYNPAVPNVVGAGQSNAENTIKQSGFTSRVTTTTVCDRNFITRHNKVVSQDPEPGTHDPYTPEITINVYQPVMPSFIGLPRLEAEQLAGQCTARPSISVFPFYEQKYQGKDGTVVSQSPEPERALFISSYIELTIYELSVPDVVDQTREAAERIVRTRGYQPKTELITSTMPAFQGKTGKVTAQVPEAGAVLPLNSVVNLTVYQPWADLEIDGINIGNGLAEGEAQSLEVSVKNSGDALPEKVVPSNKYPVRIELLYQGENDTQWRSFGLQPVMVTNLTTIEPGASLSYAFYRPATSALASGRYDIRGILDGDKQLKDRNPDNNIFESVISIDSSPILVKSFRPRAAWGQLIYIGITTGKALLDADNPVSLSVRLGDTEATIENVKKESQREYTLSVVVAEGSTSGPVTVSADDEVGISDQDIVIYGPPLITSISPDVASAGTLLKIYGMNFVPPQDDDGTTVIYPCSRLQATGCSILAGRQQESFISETEIHFEVPAEILNGPISVTTLVGGISQSASSETVFRIQPKITRFDPKQGYAGKEIQIRGTSINYDQDPSVTLAGKTAPIVTAYGDVLVVTVPEEASSGKFEVTTKNGVAVSEEDFRIIVDPTISSVSPVKGTAGTIITLQGSGLDLVTNCQIYVSSSSDTQFTNLEAVGVPTESQVQFRIPETFRFPGLATLSVFIPPHFHSNKVGFELQGE